MTKIPDQRNYIADSRWLSRFCLQKGITDSKKHHYLTLLSSSFGTSLAPKNINICNFCYNHLELLWLQRNHYLEFLSSAYQYLLSKRSEISIRNCIISFIIYFIFLGIFHLKWIKQKQKELDLLTLQATKNKTIHAKKKIIIYSSYSTYYYYGYNTNINNNDDVIHCILGFDWQVKQFSHYFVTV